MKKIVFMIMVVTGIVLFSIGIEQIVVKHIDKGKIVKIEQQMSSEITRVDITDLIAGEYIEHEHVYKTMYDENNHWEECTICEINRNVKVHSMTTTWKLGKESCNKNNSYTKTCECGYSETGHKPCVWKGKYVGGYTGYAHYKQCAVEGGNNAIKYSYYLNSYGNGAVNLVNYTNFPYIYTEFERCYKSNGTFIDSNNLGKCVVCGYNYTEKIHYLIADLDKKQINCEICGNNYGTMDNEIVRDSNVPATYTVTTKLNLTNGAVFEKTGGMRGWGATDTVWQSDTRTLISGAIGGSNVTFKTVGKLKSTLKEPYDNYVACFLLIGGIRSSLMTSLFEVYPDSIPPSISSINNSILTEWSKSKTINISGTENWASTVSVEILDEKEKPVFSGKTAVTNGVYSISCTPELEAGVEGKNFKVIVTDAYENKVEQEFNISKIDSIAPKIISGDKVGDGWSKSKRFTFSSIDSGIGNVSIAFNDIKDLGLAKFDGEKYFRDYEFVGDVYAPKELSVLYKDGLGNSSMKNITIDKIDNTAPTITDSSIHNNVLTVTAHDRHERLGEGSGVAKYRYMVSGEKLDNPVVSFDNSIEVNVNDKIIIGNIFDVKYVYVVAEDLVGNVSGVFEVKVPELVLISQVDLSAQNGEGGVRLDWSGYDISDKYFVIYRKQEGHNEWKTIVSFEEKFNGSSYMDSSGNDKNIPSISKISIEGTQENNIKITTSAVDTGTKYSYYIEAYDSNTNVLLNSSNK